MAILYDENAFGSSGFKTLTAQSTNFGVNIVDSASYKTEDTDLTAQLTKLKGSNPEVLIVWGTNPGPAVAAKGMQQLAWDIPYVGSHGIANKTFIELAGDASEGVAFPAGQLLAPSPSPTRRRRRSPTRSWPTTGGHRQPAASTFAGHAYDGLMMLIEAIESGQRHRAGGPAGSPQRDHRLASPDGIYNYSAHRSRRSRASAT